MRSPQRVLPSEACCPRAAPSLLARGGRGAVPGAGRPLLPARRVGAGARGPRGRQRSGSSGIGRHSPAGGRRSGGSRSPAVAARTRTRAARRTHAHAHTWPHAPPEARRAPPGRGRPHGPHRPPPSGPAGRPRPRPRACPGPPRSRPEGVAEPEQGGSGGAGRRLPEPGVEEPSAGSLPARSLRERGRAHPDLAQRKSLVTGKKARLELANTTNQITMQNKQNTTAEQFPCQTSHCSVAPFVSVNCRLSFLQSPQKG